MPEAVRIALEASVSRTRATFDYAASPEKLDSFLAALYAAIRRHVAGEGAVAPSLHGLPHSVAAALVECVRRILIERTDPLDDAQCVGTIAVLTALGRIERALPGELTHASEPERDGAALGAMVEIAHDMRSPLSAILFLLEMLRSGRSGPITAGQARQLAIIYGASFGLSQLVGDLIDEGRVELECAGQPVPFSVTELLHSVRDILLPVVEERGLDIRVETIHGHARLGFPNALHRVLLNLGANAVKYTTEGWVAICARELPASRVEFSVADTGPGIPRSVRAQLFQPFRYAPATGRPAFSSSGLGLSISQKLVTALGGRLRVSSSPRRGSKFVFALDLQHVAEE